MKKKKNKPLLTKLKWNTLSCAEPGLTKLDSQLYRKSTVDSQCRVQSSDGQCNRVPVVIV